MAVYLQVQSVTPGVDANRIAVDLQAVAGSSIAVSVTLSDFGRVLVTVAVGVSGSTSIADAINADPTAALYVVASGTLDGSGAFTSSGRKQLGGGSAGGGLGQYYSGATPARWLPQYVKRVR